MNNCNAPINWNTDDCGGATTSTRMSAGSSWDSTVKKSATGSELRSRSRGSCRLGGTGRRGGTSGRIVAYEACVREEESATARAYGISPALADGADHGGASTFQSDLSSVSSPQHDDRDQSTCRPMGHRDNCGTCGPQNRSHDGERAIAQGNGTRYQLRIKGNPHGVFASAMHAVTYALRYMQPYTNDWQWEVVP